MRIVMMLEICAIKDWLAVCLKEWEVVDNLRFSCQSKPTLSAGQYGTLVWPGTMAYTVGKGKVRGYMGMFYALLTE